MLMLLSKDINIYRPFLSDQPETERISCSTTGYILLVGFYDQKRNYNTQHSTAVSHKEK